MKRLVFILMLLAAREPCISLLKKEELAGLVLIFEIVSGNSMPAKKMGQKFPQVRRFA